MNKTYDSPFQKRMIELHGKLLSDMLTELDKEFMAQILEGLSNITESEQNIFEKLCSCFI
jgi:hypothetical protein